MQSVLMSVSLGERFSPVRSTLRSLRPRFLLLSIFIAPGAEGWTMFIQMPGFF